MITMNLSNSKWGLSVCVRFSGVKTWLRDQLFSEKKVSQSTHVMRHRYGQEIACRRWSVDVVFVPVEVEIALPILRTKRCRRVVRKDSTILVKERRCWEISPWRRSSVAHLEQTGVCATCNWAEADTIGVNYSCHVLGKVEDVFSRLSWKRSLGFVQFQNEPISGAHLAATPSALVLVRLRLPVTGWLNESTENVDGVLNYPCRHLGAVDQGLSIRLKGASARGKEQVAWNDWHRSKKQTIDGIIMYSF